MFNSCPKARFVLICGALTLGAYPHSFAQLKPLISKALKGWKLISSKAGGFSALFPAAPRTLVRQEGKYKVHAFVHAVPGNAYMVTYSDMRESGFSKAQIQSFGSQDMLTSTRQGLLTGSRGRLVSERRLTYQGAPARDVVYDIPQLNVRSRAYIIFARPFIYQVMTIMPKKQSATSTPTANAFLDSFQITKSRP